MRARWQRSDAAVDRATLRRWWRGDTAPLVALAAVKLAMHLATNGIYGFQRDEMYYVLSGQHPALGYVDYPPVTPLLARIDTTVLGVSPWTLHRPQGVARRRLAGAQALPVIAPAE
jgi:hypothetical protein